MVSPEEILKVAEALAKAGKKVSSTDEARYRTAASRAYYAFFHHLVQVLGLQDLIDDRQVGSVHEAVRRELLSQPVVSDEKLKQAKMHFDTIRDHRRRADYKLALNFQREDAEEAALLTRKIFNL